MASWSVEELVIPTIGITEPITSIRLQVDPGDAAIMRMELQADELYVLRFQRHGGYLGYEKVVPPPVDETPPAAQAASHDEDYEEEHPSKSSKKRRY